MVGVDDSSLQKTHRTSRSCSMADVRCITGLTVLFVWSAV